MSEKRSIHPIDMDSTAAGFFPLDSMIDYLRSEDVFATANRNAVALLHDPGLSAVLTVAKEGTECAEHSASEPAIIVGISGRLAIKGIDGSEVIEVSEGTAAVLAPHVKHTLMAITGCAYLNILGSRSS